MFEELVEFLANLENHDNMHAPLGMLTLSKGQQQISAHDLMTLRNNEYLNDTIIEAYLQLIANYFNKIPEAQKKVYVVPTFFYSTWAERKKDSVKRWFRKVNIFEYEYILFPINNEMHWSIVIVDLPRRLFTYYDSLEFTDRNQENGYVTQYIDAVRDCIEMLSKDKLQQSDYCQNFDYLSQNYPLQTNAVDCGVFMLQFARFRCKGQRSDKFEQGEMSDLRLQMFGEIIAGELLD